jgi:hypothetical protein
MNTKKRKPNATGKGRMTPATIAAVITEIEAYGRGERTVPLTWSVIITFSGFSQVSLWKRPAIKEAFSRVQQARRTDATPTIKLPRTTDERVIAMQDTIDNLRAIIRAYDEQWVRHEYNVQRLGIDPDELRKTLDPVERHIVRTHGSLRSTRRI